MLPSSDPTRVEFPVRSEDDYSEEEDEEEDEEEEEEYDGEIPQPELEPRSRRCLVGDVGVCVIPGDSEEEEEDNEEDEDGGRGDACGEDSDSDGSVLYKEDSSDEDEEDEPPLSKEPAFLYVNLLSVGSASHPAPCPPGPAFRRSGQQGEEEGHAGSEAQRPALRPGPGQVCPGQERQGRPAPGTDGPDLAEPGAVGGHQDADQHHAHPVRTDAAVLHRLAASPMFVPLLPRMTKVMKRCKNSHSFFPPSGDLARDPLPRSWNKETSFTVSAGWLFLPSCVTSEAFKRPRSSRCAAFPASSFESSRNNPSMIPFFQPKTRLTDKLRSERSSGG